MKTKVKWRETLLVLVTLCICLLIAEGITRWLYGDRTVLYPRFHEEITYGQYTVRRLVPNTSFWHHSVDGSWKFITNSQGFRSTVDYEYEKGDGVLRIACLGDSQTQGFECRQDRTYSSVLQRYFDARGIVAEVFNAGVSGYSTAEALVVLENEIIKYAPDAVVLGFYANDLDDNIKSDLFRLEQGQLVEHSYRHTPAAKILRIINATPPLRWLSQNSYLYSTLFNGAWEWAKRRLHDQKTAELTTEYAVQQDDGDGGIEERKQLLAEALLIRMHEFCQQHGIRFYLLDVPYRKDHIPPGWHSSVEYGLGDIARAPCDTLMYCRDVLGDYSGTMDVFVPHGHRHITETTHLLLGVALARDVGAHFGVLPVAGAAPVGGGERSTAN
jgi:lysophospholipase L1-like esterase